MIVRWLRVVLPPSWILGFVVFGYLAMEALMAFVWYRFQIAGAGALHSAEAELAKLLQFRDRIALMPVAVYGLYRVLAFHPFFNTGYYDWLRRSPWTIKKPLLIGPLSLTIQDFVILGTVRVLLHNYQLHDAAIPLAFLAAFSLATAFSCWLTFPRTMAYVIAFAMGIVALLAHVSLWASLAMAAIVHLVSWHGLRRSLTRFPWSDQIERWKSWILQLNSNRPVSDPAVMMADLNADKIATMYGWPINLLHPRTIANMFERFDYIWWSVLAGWLAFILLTVPNASHEGGIFAVTVSCLGLMFLRLVVYCVSYRSPISFLGRLWTGRLIIPGHDRVYVAPICAFTVGIVGCWFILTHRMNQPWVAGIAGISIVGMMLCTLLIGPSREQWRLVGQHRIWPTRKSRREFIEL